LNSKQTTYGLILGGIAIIRGRTIPLYFDERLGLPMWTWHSGHRSTAGHARLSTRVCCDALLSHRYRWQGASCHSIPLNAVLQIKGTRLSLVLFHAAARRPIGARPPEDSIIPYRTLGWRVRTLSLFLSGGRLFSKQAIQSAKRSVDPFGFCGTQRRTQVKVAALGFACDSI
jgi:hypothetical protein